jgi:hypothetical protein
MAEGGAVKVERSRARGHVASNTLIAPTEAIHSSPRNCSEREAKNLNFYPQILLQSLFFLSFFLQALFVFSCQT